MAPLMEMEKRDRGTGATNGLDHFGCTTHTDSLTGTTTSTGVSGEPAEGLLGAGELYAVRGRCLTLDQQYYLFVRVDLTTSSIGTRAL